MSTSQQLEAFRQIPFNSPQFLYLSESSASDNKPQISEDGSKCTIITKKETDWWHTPDRDSRDGLVWGFWHDIKDDEGGFEMRVGCEIAQEVKVS
jgi:hypothetical protein